MFQKRKEPASNLTVLGVGSALEGKITVRGALLVEGAVSGQVSCDAELSVGSTGRVLGEVRATQLSVAGRVDGIVYTRDHLRVLSSGQVRGHARYATLQVERGGVMSGSTSLVADYPNWEEREAAE